MATMHVLPGFSLLVLVLAACTSLTSVQSQRAGESATQGSATTRSPMGSGTTRSMGGGDTCATSRRNCMNLHTSSMDALNRQVNLELSAFYSYTAMSSYFASTDGALRGSAAFFSNQASEELSHANMFMDYIIMRGGDLNLGDIRTPNVTAFDNCLHAMEHALEMEVHVTDSLLQMFHTAEEVGDPSLTDLLDGTFISEQVDSMDQLAHYVSVLERFDGDPVGEYMFDETLYQEIRG